MKLTILVPTHDKNKDDIIHLYNFLNIKTDVIFANQNGKDEKYEFNVNGNLVVVISSSSIGVSKNRNILLNNVIGDICLCIDDDCPLVNNYENIVVSFFRNYKCDFVLFNGLVPYEGNRKVHNRRTKKVRSFFDVSYGGGPGLAFKTDYVKKNPLLYNERIGFPNYIYAGEDSLMLKTILKTNASFFRSSTVLFSVDIDKQDNSTYFRGFNDQFFITKGAIYKLLFPRMYWLITIYYCMSLSRKTKKKYFEIRNLFKKGFKYAKENL